MPESDPADADVGASAPEGALANVGKKKKKRPAEKSASQKAHKKRHDEIRRDFKKAVEYFQHLRELGFPVLTDDELKSYNKGKKRQLIDIADKYSLDETGPEPVLLFDVDDMAAHRGGARPDLEGKPITEQELRDANFFFLSYGRAYGYRMVKGQQELVFAVRFTPYSAMSNEELSKIRMCGRHFNKTFDIFNPVTTNSAHKGGGGVMAAEGWRADYHRGKDFGTYRRRWHTKKMQAEWDRMYVAHTAEMESVSAYYEDSYQRLCPAARQHSLKWMEDNTMPPYGTVRYKNRPFSKSSGSNLTVTRGDFSNKFHRDRDATPFTFGIWFLADINGDPVMDEDVTRTAVRGGQFALPEFMIAVDFGACTGKVDMMWRGKKDLHATAASQTSPGYQRIGTSIQGAKRLWDRVVAAGKKSPGKVNIVDG